MTNTTSDAAALQRLTAEAERYPVLNSVEQSLLLHAYVIHKDENAKRDLVNSSLRHAVDVAWRHRSKSLSLEELYGAAVIGLLDGMEKFKQVPDGRLEAYSYQFMVGAIKQAIRENVNTMNLGKGKRSQEIYKASRYIREEQLALGSDDNKRTVNRGDMGDMGLDQDDWETLHIVAMNNPLSLNAHLEDGGEFGSLVADIADPESAIILDDLLDFRSDHIAVALDQLSDNQRQAVILHYGLEGADPMTFQEIADEMGLSRQRTYQLVDEAKRSMRSSLETVEESLEPSF